MTLSDAMPGMGFRVLRVRVGGEIGRRLADMGFTEGARGELVRGALMRGPIQVRLGGYDLLIRRGEAACVEIESEQPQDSRDAGSAGRGSGRGHGKGRWGGRGEGHDHGPGRGFGSWGSRFRGLFRDADCCAGARGAGMRDAGRDREEGR